MEVRHQHLIHISTSRELISSHVHVRSIMAESYGASSPTYDLLKQSMLHKNLLRKHVVMMIVLVCRACRDVSPLACRGIRGKYMDPTRTRAVGFAVYSVGRAFLSLLETSIVHKFGEVTRFAPDERGRL